MAQLAYVEGDLTKMGRLIDGTRRSEGGFPEVLTKRRHSCNEIWEKKQGGLHQRSGCSGTGAGKCRVTGVAHDFLKW
jgi:hypothetical protein